MRGVKAREHAFNIPRTHREHTANKEDKEIRHTMTEYRFCPRCATPLTERADALHEGGRVRQSCPDVECGYVHWNNPLPVVAAIVEYEGKILLARNAAWPEGMFALITGFLENGETPEQGIAREVLEETSLHTETVEL